jgi:ABC-type antimicrobial peptide transport system permease subunit
MFLIETPELFADDPDRALDRIAQTFETALSDYGFDVERSGDRLANFMAVQNTYLSTFQSLGGLGLLLGTFGLATVQLRNVLERRGELALLRATGFRRRRLGELVMLENAALLCFGLGTGILAALVAILPNLLRGDASIPWLSLVGTLALVLSVGLLAGMAAVRAMLRAPLLEALRGE